MALVLPAMRVSCSGVLTGNEKWANVWHVGAQTGAGADDPIAGADTNDIIDAFTDFYTAIADRWANVTTLDQIVTQPLPPCPTPGVSAAPAVTGTGGVDILPPQLAVVLSIRTGLSGRSYRGRVFLGGFDEGVTTDGSARINTATRDDIGAAAVALDVALDAIGVGWDTGVYSRKLDEFHPTSFFRVGTVVDTQRRRRSQIIEQYVSYF